MGGPFRMSACLQELVVYAGEGMVFREASEYLGYLAGIEVNAKQVERVCHHYGAKLEEKATDPAEDQPVAPDRRLHYGMIDGSMILTREEKWMEMKLARIFPAESRIAESAKRNWVRDSTYVAHLGGHKGFFEKLAYQTDGLPQMVWIGDGAKWIWKWVGEHYPQAVQILDFYHAKEKLCEFAILAIKDPLQRSQWIEQQVDRLLADQLEAVITEIKNHLCPAKARQKHRGSGAGFRICLGKVDYLFASQLTRGGGKELQWPCSGLRLSRYG